MKNDKKKYVVMILNILIMVCNFIVGNINSNDNSETVQGVESLVEL